MPPGAVRRRLRCEERGKGVEHKEHEGAHRRVLTAVRLNADVKRRIDTMIEKGFSILIGDANFGEERA